MKRTPRAVGGRWGIAPNTARIVADELRRLAREGATPADLLARAGEIERDWTDLPAVRLHAAERRLDAAREALRHVEHGAGDEQALQRYEAALDERNAARVAAGEGRS